MMMFENGHWKIFQYIKEKNKTHLWTSTDSEKRGLPDATE